MVQSNEISQRKSVRFGSPDLSPGRFFMKRTRGIWFLGSWGHWRPTSGTHTDFIIFRFDPKHTCETTHTHTLIHGFDRGSFHPLKRGWDDPLVILPLNKRLGRLDRSVANPFFFGVCVRWLGRWLEWVLGWWCVWIPYWERHVLFPSGPGEGHA